MSQRFTLIALVGTYGDIGGSIIAIPGIAEKGYVDTRVKVSTSGGHSSVPPAHTVSRNGFPMVLIEYISIEYRDLVAPPRGVRGQPHRTSSRARHSYL
jgi:hypothetical protein